MPRTLALAGLALIAVLPEYAVDMLFAWKAGKDPSYAAYATANMTGGNRLLIGLGWTMVVGILWLRSRKSILKLAEIHRIEVGLLGVATVYSFIIPLRGGITLFDAAFLVGALRRVRLPRVARRNRGGVVARRSRRGDCQSASRRSGAPSSR